MTGNNNDYVIIVAGGKGLRMGGNIPKQFLPINDIPVLMRTIMRFKEYDSNMKVVLVLPEEQQDYWRILCLKYNFGAGCMLVNGGKTRFHSVKNGLAKIPRNASGVVGVHDGVRPFVSVDVIRRCYETARSHGTAVPVVPVVETIRHIVDGENSRTVPRDEYRLVQTPQTFDIKLLKKAYAQGYDEAFTDDASVVEKMGHGITLVDGNRENIKLTTPFDLRLAMILSEEKR